jgi:hypothetical protein
VKHVFPYHSRGTEYELIEIVCQDRLWTNVRNEFKSAHQAMIGLVCQLDAVRVVGLWQLQPHSPLRPQRLLPIDLLIKQRPVKPCRRTKRTISPPRFQGLSRACLGKMIGGVSAM